MKTNPTKKKDKAYPGSHTFVLGNIEYQTRAATCAPLRRNKIKKTPSATRRRPSSPLISSLRISERPISCPPTHRRRCSDDPFSLPTVGACRIRKRAKNVVACESCASGPAEADFPEQISVLVHSDLSGKDECPLQAHVPAGGRLEW